MAFLRTYWWKLLAVMLVTYSVVMSFTVRLSPGILTVQPSQVTAGPNSLLIHGYNTSFKGLPTKVWLSAEEGRYLIPAGKVKAFTNSRLWVEVVVPAGAPSRNFDLVLSNPSDGTLLFRDALFGKDLTEEDGSISPDPGPVPEVEENYFSFPFKSLLFETIRNLNFHVTMWFALLFTMLLSVISSIRYLSSGSLRADREALEAARTGIWFGILGLITGSIWARYTWGAWWVNDTKLNGAAISMLIYLAYLVLRNSMNEEQKRARISAVYNIFAFVMLVVFIQVLPRLTDSLHPGNGGNPAFGQYDLDNNLRLVFYPAVAGWILVALWITRIRSRMAHIEYKLNNEND